VKTFFVSNINQRGRLWRGILGGVLLVGGIVACSYSAWLCIVLVASGGFALYEAARGWCVMRACGIRTKR